MVTCTLTDWGRHLLLSGRTVWGTTPMSFLDPAGYGLLSPDYEYYSIPSSAYNSGLQRVVGPSDMSMVFDNVAGRTKLFCKNLSFKTTYVRETPQHLQLAVRMAGTGIVLSPILDILIPASVEAPIPVGTYYLRPLDNIVAII